MKYIYLIIIFLVARTVDAEQKIDITPIELPYDSLVLTDIYAYNVTILVRSENTIYKSTDNGDNWKICFETNKKICQLYSQDPHTIFVVGDSGMVHRTFDYGDTWFDISYNKDQNFKGIAAKNFKDYMIITDKIAFVNNPKSLTGEITALEFISGIPLYDVIFSVDKYYFNGLKHKEVYRDYMGIDRVNLELPYNIYNGEKVTSLKSLSINGTLGDGDTFIDSLKLYPSQYGIYHSAMSTWDNSSGINLNSGVNSIYNYNNNLIDFSDDNIIHVDEYLENTHFFTRQGKWAVIETESLKTPAYRSLKNIEHQYLNIKPINSAVRTSSKSFYIASNNSTIYRADFTDVISSVEKESSIPIEVHSNFISFIEGVEIMSVYNYMGYPLQFTKVSDYVIILPIGMNFITYKFNGNIKTMKVSVVE